jgi:hypothetical protein
MAGLDDDAVALDRADQCRVGVVLRVLPLVRRDRHRLDVHAGFDDRVVLLGACAACASVADQVAAVSVPTGTV